LRSPLTKAIGAKSCTALTRICKRKTSDKAEIMIIYFDEILVGKFPTRIYWTFFDFEADRKIIK